MKINRKKLRLGLCGVAMMLTAETILASGFVVSDIKIEGLQRVSTGTVLNYLPVEVGEEVDAESTAEIIRALYETGFFQSVELGRQGSTLIIKVVERATIGSIHVTGNSEIPSDKMKDILKELGLVKGRIYQRSSLERLEKELKQAYNARGKYNARIDSHVAHLTENRVGISVTVSEGRVSRIKEIQIVGNHDFDNDTLLGELKLSTSDIFTYFSKKDQYTKAEMDASLEALRSFYLDRGYLKFKIISSQVMLSPDKKDVYINIHLYEGPQYRFSGFAVLGKTILPKKKIDDLILVKKGEVFSRKKVSESISAIGLALGDIGYGFPAINAEPKIDEKEKTVFVNFVVEPGRHVYVRRINFHGNTKTADYVLRNVIRQDEGGLLSLHNIKESERHLRLLGYLKDVNVKTTPVPGANNQVDLDIDVEEAPSAEAKASIGYGTNGPQFDASVNQHNFMGTGRSVGFGFNASYWGQDYTFNYYDPFYGKNGVGRGLTVYYQAVDPTHLDVTQYNSDRFGGDITYNFPLSENSNFQLGYGYQGLNIKSVGSVQQIQNFVNLYGSDFQQIRLTGGWNKNTYDQMPYPTSGLNQQFTVLTSVPATNEGFSFYKAAYHAHLYQPLMKGFILSLFGNLSYGNSFNSEGLPFYENYYAGGIAQPGQVRGYDSFSLGPQDNFGNSLGGNFLANGTVALIMPYPLSRDTVRTSAFMDFGNVYAYGVLPALKGTDSGPLRYSAGLSVEWRSPFGPIGFSLAKPINMQPGDQAEYFQFSVSSGL